MANFVLKDAYLYLNSIDMSTYVQSISLPLEAASVDNTCMGDSDLSALVGMKSATFTVTFAADSADGDTTEDLYDIWAAGVAVPWVIGASGSSIGVTNPHYSGSCIMTSFPIVDGTVGDLATHNCSFQVTTAVARDES